MILQQYKIVFGGTMGAGKSAAIKAISDVNVISTEAEGLSVQIEDAAEIAAAYLDSCGTPYDSLVNKTQSQGVRRYDYTLSWNWQMI